MCFGYRTLETILLPIAILEFVFILDFLEVGFVSSSVRANLPLLWHYLVI